LIRVLRVPLVPTKTRKMTLTVHCVTVASTQQRLGISSVPLVLSIRTHPWAALPKVNVFAMLVFRAEKMLYVLNALLANIR